jgi:predicted kinase
MAPSAPSSLRPRLADAVLRALPEARPRSRRRAFLFVCIGLPGSGKSTFARRLAPATGAVLVESDALRRRLFRRPTHAPRENAALFAAVHAAMDELLADGVPVVLDATNLTASERRPLRAIAERRGATLLLALFEAPAATIEGRLAARAAGLAPGDGSTAGPEVHARMAPRLQPPARADWRVDSSDVEAFEEALRQATAACLRTSGGWRGDGADGK